MTSAVEGTSGRAGKGRIVSFDVIRLIAISCVVLCHSVETVYKASNLSLGYGLAHYLGRLGVPLFLFLTGALIINKEFDSDSIKRFFSHNWFGLVITSEVWILVYWVYGSLHRDAFDFGLLVRYATFQEKLPHGFWWYVPTILSIYVVLPFIARAVKGCKTRDLLVPLAFCLTFSFALPTANQILKCLGGNIEPIKTTLKPFYAGGEYVTYIILGYLVLRRQCLRELRPCVLACGLLGFSVAGILAARTEAGIWYNSLWLLGTSVCGVELVRRLFDRLEVKELPSVLTLVSKGAFGIYMVHMLVMKVVMMIPLGLDSAFPRTMSVWVMTLLASAAFVVAIQLLLRNHPRAKRVLLDC